MCPLRRRSCRRSASGDETVYQLAALDKSENFDVRKVPTFRKLADEQVFSRPVVIFSRPVVSPEMSESLEADKFNLVMKQLDYDARVFETWERKCQTVKLAREHSEHDWRLQQRQRVEKATEVFFNGCLRLVVWEKKSPEKAISEILDFKRQVIRKKTSLHNLDQITHVVWMNCATPCLITTDIQHSMAQVLSWALHDQMQSVGLMLSPVWTYLKGKLHLEDASLHFLIYIFFFALVNFWPVHSV